MPAIKMSYMLWTNALMGGCLQWVQTLFCFYSVGAGALQGDWRRTI